MIRLKKLNQRQQKVLQLFLQLGGLQSSAVRLALIDQGEEIALVTVKRLLAQLYALGALDVVGSGRSTAYQLTVLGRLLIDIDPKAYCSLDPDGRFGTKNYSFDFFSQLPSSLFTAEELQSLKSATVEYSSNNKGASTTLRKKEHERFVIELAWKSSKIEGNTYTLLDTERLLREGVQAFGHDQAEAQMILNHKTAFQFIWKNLRSFKSLNRAHLEEVHKLLIKGLGVKMGLRSKPVGVAGSVYRPLDNVHQIREAVTCLLVAVARVKTPYDKALLLLLGISYIQPFEDGNKRTARLIANAILLSARLAPLSYRSVDENIYKAATLVFYELNVIIPFKKIFLEQYQFAARNYLL
jgi:fido (protein-threonine AMPylation protein)